MYKFNFIHFLLYFYHINNGDYMKIKVFMFIIVLAILFFSFYIYNNDNIDLKPYLEKIKNSNNITYSIRIKNNEDDTFTSYKINRDKIESERIINDTKWLHSYILINDNISYVNSLYQGNKWIMYDEYEENLINFDYIDILINSIDFDNKIRLSQKEAQEVLNILNNIAGTNNSYNVLNSINVLVETNNEELISIKLDYSNKINSVDIGIYDEFVVELNISNLGNTLVVIPNNVINHLEVSK